jgi:hypothetical protein
LGLLPERWAGLGSGNSGYPAFARQDLITIGGRVTLRGPLSSAEEKRLIGEIADRIAHSENVDNQLEVKFTTNSNN